MIGKKSLNIKFYICCEIYKMAGIKPPSPRKIWRFSSAHFYRKVISEINNLWYNILEVTNGINGP